MRIVHVEWIDSETDLGWEAPDYSDWLDLVHTVGILVAETENYVVVANSFDPGTGECNGRISIPLVAIKEMRNLCHVNLKQT